MHLILEGPDSRLSASTTSLLIIARTRYSVNNYSVDEYLDGDGNDNLTYGECKDYLRLYYGEGNLQTVETDWQLSNGVFRSMGAPSLLCTGLITAAVERDRLK